MTSMLLTGIGELVTNDPSHDGTPLGLVADAAVVVESASAAAEGRRPATSHGEDADHALDHAEDLDDLPITLETLGADEVPGLTDPWRGADEPDDAGPGAASSVMGTASTAAAPTIV